VQVARAAREFDEKTIQPALSDVSEALSVVNPPVKAGRSKELLVSELRDRIQPVSLRKSEQERRSTMPMIDVYAPEDLFPPGSDRALGEQLTKAVLRAEGLSQPTAFHSDNTAAFIHLLPADRLQTAATGSARVVRVQVLTPPSALSREGQKQLVREITDIVGRIAGDSTLQKRTWVLLTEGTAGGWGIAGTAFGKEEFIALAQGTLKL
jgi:phenylpyruvate tautomerase PptA (4-oxalocrotonate tautomerase family)